MARSRTYVVDDARDDVNEPVARRTYRRRVSSVAWLSSLIGFFVGLAEIILGFRVIFRLFAANSATPFVDWVYRTSDNLMAPFRGMFPTEHLSDNGHVLDFSAIFAMLVYAFIGYLLIKTVDRLE